MRHSRARKGNPVRSFFIVRTRQAEGDGGQWRGCQQCTLGKACEEAAVKPVSTLSKPCSSGIGHCCGGSQASQRREALLGLETLQQSNGPYNEGIIRLLCPAVRKVSLTFGVN